MTQPVHEETREMCYWSGRWVEPATLKPVEVEVTGFFGFSKQRDMVMVLPEHEAKLRAFFAFVSRYGTVFLGLLMVNVALSLLVLTYRQWGFLGIGVLLIIFPFTTNVAPAFGIHRSVILARVIGALMMGFGLISVLR